MKVKTVNNTKNKHLHWKVLDEKDILVIEPRLRVSVQSLILPDGKIVKDYYQIHLPESVIIVAHTNDNKIVMSRQYLHGFMKVSIVLPAGTMEKDELPLRAAQRELMEETGYTSEEWHILGSLVPHTNHRCGRVHFFYAAKAKQTAKPNLADFEEMEIILMDESQIIEAIRDRHIISMGTITALTLAKVFLSDKLNTK